MSSKFMGVILPHSIIITEKQQLWLNLCISTTPNSHLLPLVFGHHFQGMDGDRWGHNRGGTSARARRWQESVVGLSAQGVQT